MTAAAYELAAMEKDKTTNAARMIATLRSFPKLAKHDLLARVRDPEVSASEKEAIGADITAAIRTLAHRYVDEYRETYDKIRAGGRTYDEIVESAGSADQTLLEDLRLGGGETSDVAELQHAMGKEDVEAVKAILKRQPNREAIDKLIAGYDALGSGRNLRRELFGVDRSGDVNADWAATVEQRWMTAGGLVTGRDAAQLDELLRKPTAEQLSGKATFGMFGVPKAPGQPEIEWMAGGAEKEYQVTMAHRGVTGHVREWGGDPETEKILKKTRSDIPELTKQWNEAKDPGLKQHLRSEIQKARATLSGDADAYEKDNARALAEFQSALSFAVSIALAVAIPGAGAGLVAFLETTALNIAANVASNFVIKGGEYGWGDLKGDVLGGVLGAAGGKFGEEVLGKVASRVFSPAAKATTETASKLGIESVLAREAGAALKTTEKVAIGVEEFEAKEAGQGVAKAIAGEEKAAQEGVKAATEGADVAAAGERANSAAAASGERAAAGEGSAAAGAGERAAAGGGGAGPVRPPMSTGEKWAREIGAFFGGIEGPKVLTGDFDLSIEEVLKALAATGAGKFAHGRRTAAEARAKAAQGAAASERGAVVEGGPQARRRPFPGGGHGGGARSAPRGGPRVGATARHGIRGRRPRGPAGARADGGRAAPRRLRSGTGGTAAQRRRLRPAVTGQDAAEQRHPARECRWAPGVRQRAQPRRQSPPDATWPRCRW